MITSRERWRLASAAASSLPSGEFCSSAAITLSLIWLASISWRTFCVSSGGTTRLSCSVHSRSRMIAAAPDGAQDDRPHKRAASPHDFPHADDPVPAKLSEAASYRSAREMTAGARECAGSCSARVAGAHGVRISEAFQALVPRTQLARPLVLSRVRRPPSDPGLWSLQRRAMTGAFGAGLAICFVPLPVHLPLARSVRHRLATQYPDDLRNRVYRSTH